MSEFYDALETRAPALREAAQFAALPEQVARAAGRTPAFAAILAGVDGASITSRAALARLPVTRKSELLERQKTLRGRDAFGGFSAIGWTGQPAATGVAAVARGVDTATATRGVGCDHGAHGHGGGIDC